ncbi:MAG: hypothetical protein FWC27_13420 [Firmicutes bacterium]|nr:hypothetical protein [Bacillota bacterium]
MKKTWKSTLAVLLTTSLLLGTAAVPAHAALGDLQSKEAQANLLNRLGNFFLNDVLLRAISAFIPRLPGTYSAKDFDLEKYGGFYKGHDAFLDAPAAGAVWRLGYDKQSILPEDFGKAKMKYARGSYVPWAYVSEVYKDDDGEQEFVGVRTIVLEDGSGRGAVSFSSIDCIGLSNADVRKIRAAVADYAAKNEIVSVNVSATHTHTGIDSQGVWTKPLSTLFNNFLSGLTFGLIKAKSGVNADYLNKIISATAASIQAAHAEMLVTEGTLTYAVKDVKDYNHDRTPPFVEDDNLYRLVFTPKETGKRPTVVASYACHPESASFGDEMPGFSSKITADSIYYMDKIISRAGSNFIFIQGNVGTVTSSRGLSNDGLPGLSSHGEAMRFGYELGLITLGMDKTQAQCRALNDELGDPLGVNAPDKPENYTVWYKDWVKVGSTDVEPVLNIAHKQLTTEAQNNMAKVLAKAGLADITMIYDWKSLKYYTVTEVGYMELGEAGGDVKVFLSPGEIYGELLMGDAVYNTMEGFPYAPLRELYGDNLIIFDLMNDAAGYVEPDNQYVIVGYRYNKDKDALDSDTWALLVSMGKNAASDIVGAFIALVGGVR